MATIRYQNRGNKWYVYELNQYWDKELKKPRQKTKYLGVAEEKGGPYSKPGKKPAVKLEKDILDFGDSYAINETSRQIGLSTIIDDSFGDLDSIMSLICFQISEGSAMYNFENWLNGNNAKNLFSNAKTTSQDISKLIKKLGKIDLQTKFFKDYIAKFFSHKCGILIDSTALPSAINTHLNAFGYADGSVEENISCLMLVESKTKLPIYFRAVGGDIADISTLETTVAEIKKLGLEAGSAILDAGFCSKSNLQFMCNNQINFVTRLPKSHKIFGSIVNQCRNIESSNNAIGYGDRVVFIKSKKMKIYDHEIYAHVILDPAKKSKDTTRILKDNIGPEVTKEEKKELDDKMKDAGFFILLSSENIDAKEILPTYYTRQAIEQIFSFAKTNNNLLPLRVHNADSVRGYLMLVFLALIVFITMRQKIKIPMDKAMLILRNLKAKVFDDEIVLQEPNKKVKDIFKNLDIIMPT